MHKSKVSNFHIKLKSFFLNSFNIELSELCFQRESDPFGWLSQRGTWRANTIFQVPGVLHPTSLLIQSYFFIFY